MDIVNIEYGLTFNSLNNEILFGSFLGSNSIFI